MVEGLVRRTHITRKLMLGLAGVALAIGVFLSVRSDAFLVWMITHFHESWARLSLMAGADPNARDGSHATVLMLASSAYEASVVESLLKHGAQIDAIDDHGSQAIHYAAASADQEGSTVRLLLKWGADPEAKTRERDVPLAMSISEMSGSTEANALLLIAHSKNVNQPDSQTGDTPLMIATTEASLPVLRSLLRAGANPNLPNHRGDLPVELVVGMPDRLGLLLEYGANPCLKMGDVPSAYEKAKKDPTLWQVAYSFERRYKGCAAHGQTISN